MPQGRTRARVETGSLFERCFLLWGGRGRCFGAAQTSERWRAPSGTGQEIKALDSRIERDKGTRAEREGRQRETRAHSWALAAAQGAAEQHERTSASRSRWSRPVAPGPPISGRLPPTWPCSRLLARSLALAPLPQKASLLPLLSAPGNANACTVASPAQAPGCLFVRPSTSTARRRGLPLSSLCPSVAARRAINPAGGRGGTDALGLIKSKYK